MTTRSENFQAIKHGLLTLLPVSDNLLRPAQKQVLTDFLNAPEDISRGVFELATAFGKTRIMKMLIMSYLRSTSTGQAVILVPTQELVKQTRQKFVQFDSSLSDIGLFYAKQKDTDHQIIVTTYSSLEKLQTQIDVNNVGLLLLDEAHHAISDLRSDTVRLFKNACWYGMTATPYYNSNRTLSDLLGHTIVRIDVPQAISDGLLASFKNILLVSKANVDMSHVRKNTTGEYDQQEYYQALKAAFGISADTNTSDWEQIHHKIARQIALFYRDFIDPDSGESAYGRQCLINCRTKEEAEIQAAEINQLFGRTIAETWHSDTINKQALTDFENGKFLILCQIAKLEEGYDFPGVSLCINYPTASRVRSAQRGGRVLRLDPDNPDKFAWIVDMVFSHPEAKNDSPLISAELNRQILFSDTARATVAISQKNDKSAVRHYNSKTHSQTICLPDFDIVSNTALLSAMYNEKQKPDTPTYLPKKEPGMLTAFEVGALFSCDRLKVLRFFEFVYNNQITVPVDGEDVCLLVQVQSDKEKPICLRDNSPQTLQRLKDLFIEITGHQFLPQSKACMLPAREFAFRLSCNAQKVKRCLEDAYNKGVTISVNGQEEPLVVFVRRGNRPSLCIRDTSPETIKLFTDLYADQIDYAPPKTPSMITANEFSAFMHYGGRKMNACFQDAYQKHITTRTHNGNEPIIVKARSFSQVSLYIRDTKPETIKTFMDLYVDQLNFQYLPLKTSDMLSANELEVLLKSQSRISHSYHFFAKFLKYVYATEATAFLDGEEVPLVVQVKSGAQACLCLRDKKLLDAFLSLMEKIQDKTPQMRSADELSVDLNCPPAKIRPCLKDAFQTQKTANLDGQSIPLVVRARNDKHRNCFCLHDIRLLYLFQELYDIQLSGKPRKLTTRKPQQRKTDRGKIR